MRGGSVTAIAAQRQRTNHALGPFVHDLDQPEFELRAEPFLGDVGAVLRLYATDAFRDFEDRGFTLWGEVEVSAGAVFGIEEKGSRLPAWE